MSMSLRQSIECASGAANANGRRASCLGVKEAGRTGRRGMVWAAALLGALLAAAWLGSALDAGLFGRFADGADEESFIEVTVRSGDTLWSLAREYGPDGRDIRETIDRIRRINGLEERASLRPGETLAIPTR